MRAAWWRCRPAATPAKPRRAEPVCSPGRRQTKEKESFTDQQETLSTLAQDTGGKALLDDNDLAMGIVQAQQDIHSYYILGYYSTESATDGSTGA